MSQQIFQKSTQMFLSRKGIMNLLNIPFRKRRNKSFIYDSYGEHLL